MSTVLKNITINSFKGISENSPVIIDFNTEANIVYLKGDQGEGKSSTLEGIERMMGAELELNIKEYYNNGERLSGEMPFTYNGVSYVSVMSGDKLEVKSLRESDGVGKDKWVKEPSPKDLLSKIFRKCVVKSDFRYEKPEKQAEWASGLFPLPKDVRLAVENAKVKIANLSSVERPAIGKKVKEYETLMKSNPLYVEYTEKGPALEAEIKKAEKAQTKSDIESTVTKYQEFKTAETGLASYKNVKVRQESELSEIENQIAELEKKKLDKANEIKATEERIKTGEAFIEKNRKIVKQYEDAMELQKTASTVALRISNFNTLVDNMGKYNVSSEEYIQIDSNIKEVTATIKSLKADYIPQIDGVEIITEQEYENDELIKDIGIYHDGVNLRTLSGSEYITTMIKIIRAAGSRYVFIDDLATYGSETIEYINQLAQEIKPENGVIFATEMSRHSDLTITMEESI